MGKTKLQTLKRRFIRSRILYATIAVIVFLGLILLSDYMLAGPLAHWHVYWNDLQNYMLDNRLPFYSIYMFSEILNLMPPEIFILALKSATTWSYIWEVSVLAVFSYMAGIMVYAIGIWMRRWSLFSALYI